MVRQGNLAGQSKLIGGDYHYFINGGTTHHIKYYEKLNRSQPKCMTVCIESCGTVPVELCCTTSEYPHFSGK